ncbi:MAG: histidine kinase [Bacteroidota bacterium]
MKRHPTLLQEVLFQIILLLVVFIFFTVDRNQPNIKLDRVIFFSTYVLAYFLISYLLLPKFFYKKKYLWFAFYFALIITGIIAIEELVLEQIFYPDTRGRRFPGVVFSLLQILPIIIILTGFKFAWDATWQRKELELLRNSLRESELQFLKTQINPHFLFNNLNNLYAYAIEASPRTPEFILKLSGVLRYMLYDCKSAVVPLEKELQQLSSFIELGRLQIEGRGKVQFQTIVTPDHLKIAPLILVVFVENAFKHSNTSQLEDIDIKIKVNLRQERHLYFECTNNYQTISNTEDLDKGIGLENVKKRLELMYPNAHELEVKDSANEYRVSLRLDLLKVNAQ